MIRCSKCGKKLTGNADSMTIDKTTFCNPCFRVRLFVNKIIIGCEVIRRYRVMALPHPFVW